MTNKTTKKPKKPKRPVYKAEQLVADWIKALRSGKYQQTNSALCDINDPANPMYCCLGVLCEVYKSKLPLETAANEDNSLLLYEGHEGDLPDKVMKTACLNTSEGSHEEANEDEFPGTKSTCLVTKNDMDGYDFNQIANLIESQPKGMFTKKLDLPKPKKNTKKKSRNSNRRRT